MTEPKDGLPDDSAPGWDAIDAAFEPLYRGQEPRHVGRIMPWSLGGSDPLDGINAWKRIEPVPHWHFVSYGLTDLYAKEGDDPEYSGWGFELTFRLACDPYEDAPPMWAFSLMQNVARYVFDSGNPLRHGEWMNANGPIAADEITHLRSLAFMLDPEVPPTDTPHGKVEFIQMVGLTLDEETAAKQWAVRKLLETLQPHMPLWVTDIGRSSLLAAPGVQAAVDAGKAADGSSTGVLLVSELEWKTERRLLRPPLHTIRIGASKVEELHTLLALRVPFGREFRIAGKDAAVTFELAEHDAVGEQDGRLLVQLTPRTLEAVARTVRPIAGDT